MALTLQYYSNGDYDNTILRKILQNQVYAIVNGGGGGGAVSSVFGRTGVVVADTNDYAAFYGQLASANSWSGINTFSSAFILPPATITVAGNTGTIDVTKVRSVATNNANLALTPNGTGAAGQQIRIDVVNSDTADHTVTGAGSASAISYTAAASSTTTTYWGSNGTTWSIIGGPVTIKDLSTITPATGDLVALWDISAGITGKTTVATLVSTALTGTPATVAQGGTGLATLTSGSLLVGAGTGNVTFITPGTGVATALAVNVGSAGAFVTFNGALGTPSSGTLTNATGLPITGLTGLGTGVATALALNVGSAGAPVTFNGALGTPSSGTLSSCTVDGTTSVGFLSVPSNSQSTAYTAVLADSGKAIDHPATDANARTFTIPANSSVAYPIGTVLSFTNMTSQVVTIAITTDTMYLAGTGTTGSRSLAQYGVATARKILSTTWLISGVGLT